LQIITEQTNADNSRGMLAEKLMFIKLAVHINTVFTFIEYQEVLVACTAANAKTVQ